MPLGVGRPVVSLEEVLECAPLPPLGEGLGGADRKDAVPFVIVPTERRYGQEHQDDRKDGSYHGEDKRQDQAGGAEVPGKKAHREEGRDPDGHGEESARRVGTPADDRRYHPFSEPR